MARFKLADVFMGTTNPCPFAPHLRHYRQFTYVLGPVKEDLILTCH